MDNIIVSALNNTMWKTDLAVNLAEISEIGLDQITENDILKDVPLVGTLVSLGKAAVAIRDRHLLKKTLAFVLEINNGTISEQKLEKHRGKLESDAKRMEKELEHILILLDRNNGLIKSIILSNLYKSYMDEDIEFNWDTFCVFCEILENFSVYDANHFKDIYDKKRYREGEGYREFAISRLSSIGLVDYYNGMLVNGDNDERIMAKINPVGSAFYELGLQKSIETITEILEKGLS